MMRKILVGFAAFLPALVLTTRAATVTNTTPRGWSSAATSATLAAFPDSPLTGATNFTLHSAWRGKRSGSLSVNGTRLVFTPGAALLPGEMLESTLSATDTSFGWRFTAKTVEASGLFVTNANSTVISTNSSFRFRSIALADVNGNNTLEVIAPVYNTSSLFIASNQPPKVALSTLAGAIYDVAAGDFNADGLPDLVLGCASQKLVVALNTGNGSYSHTLQTLSGVSGPLRQVVVGDLNSDGAPDAMALAESSMHLIPLINNGSGTLTPGTPVACSSTLLSFDLGDLNNDGKPDVAAVGMDGFAAILLNNGAGELLPPVEQTACEEHLYMCKMADFNGDGRADVAAVGAGGIVLVAYGSETGLTFSRIEHDLSINTFVGLAVGDCDGNGKPDIVVCGGDTVAVLLGGDTGFMTHLPPVVIADEVFRDVELGDMNADGRLDLAVCSFTSGKVRILWNSASPVPLVTGINGVSVNSGSAATPSNGTDFGTVHVLGSYTNQFRLINSGEGPLQILSATLNATNLPLSILAMPTNVSPGATSVFSIVYTPMATGTTVAVLTLTNNSSITQSNAASPYIINLAAAAVRRPPDVLALSGTNQIYDGAAKAVTVSLEPVELESSLTLTYNGSASAPTNAGTYQVIAKVDAAFYFSAVTGQLIIAKRTLTTGTLDESRVYGESNPVFQVTLSNFVSNETAAALATLPTASCSASNTSPAGPYSIVLSGGSASNYQFQYVNGTLTVTQAVLTARADNISRPFNTPNPPLTISYEGWKNNEGTNVFLTPPTAVTPANSASPVGTYPITASNGVALNYSFFYIPGTLTVYATVADVFISNTQQVYNGQAKQVTVTTVPSGLVNTVTYNGLSTLPVTAGVYVAIATVNTADFSGSSTALMTIAKAPQALTSFLPPSSSYSADSLLTLSAAGSPSGIPIVFAIQSGPAEMASSNQLRFLNFGTVTVSAWQPGDSNWIQSPALTNTYSAFETNATHYAAQAGQTPRWPYASWETAASNIQVAVDQASTGETVLVGSGIYNDGGRPASAGMLTNRLVLDKAVAVEGVAGAASTFLVGKPGAGAQTPMGSDAIRCAFITNGASLKGFTLMNGHTDGAAAGVADQIGGGALVAATGLLQDSIIAGCSAFSGGGLAGGNATRCELVSNDARQEGGGALEARLTDCLLKDNAAIYGGGAFRSDLVGCTLVENEALFGGGAYEGRLANSIAWYNTGWDCFGTLAWNVNAGSGITAGVNDCISLEPLFVNPEAGNFHLAYGSPCINSGDNSFVMPGDLDLDGAPRIRLAITDMGAYEFYGTPADPTLLPPTGIKAHQADIQWQPGSNRVRVIQYRLAVTNLSNGGAATDWLTPDPGVSCVVSGLTHDTAYACRVRAENDYDLSGWSGWQSFTTLTESVIAISTSLTFNVAYASGVTTTQIVSFANPGATPCSWSGHVSYVDGSGWLNVTPAQGIVSALSSTGLVVAVNHAGLNAGTYAALHTLTSPNATNSPQVQLITLNVARAIDVIEFSLTNQVYNGTPRPVSVTTFSGEPVQVTYNGSTTPPDQAGVYAVTGRVDAANWTATQTVWLTIAKAPQSVTSFLPASSDIPSTNTVDLSAVGGGSGQPVTFSVVSGPAELDGTRMVFKDYGTVTVRAQQAGNANWQAAPPVTNLYRIVPVAGLVHFVAQDGQTPRWPFFRRTEAASNIQDGVDAAWDGDTVLVSNGTYTVGGRPAEGGLLTNRVIISRAITLQSVNGAAVTLVQGAEPATAAGFDAIRCLYAETNAVIRGFTFTNGHTALTGNLTDPRSGGGVFLRNGAELRHCIVTGNRSSSYGGGAYVLESGRVNNCLITGNTSERGGGACLFGGGDLFHSTVVSNTGTMAPGGVYIPAGGVVCNSIVWGNRAPLSGPQDLLSLAGLVSYTLAGDGVVAGIAGCLNADPLFNAPGQFELTAGSPCVDAGDGSRVLVATDLKDDPRVALALDMGAYEWVTPPGEPTNTTVTARTRSSALLSWEYQGMPATSFEAQVEQLPDETLALSTNLPGGILSFTAEGLATGTDYRWRVRGANSRGTGPWTPWQTFTTLGVLQTVTPDACLIGGGLEITIEGIGLGRDSDITSVTLAGVSATITDQDRDWVKVMAAPAAVAGTGDVHVSSPTGGELVLSNAFTYVDTAAPVLLPPTDITSTSLAAHWLEVDGAIAYELQVAPASNFASMVSITTAATNGCTVDGLTPGPRFLRLRARMSQGFSPFSATLELPAGEGLPWVMSEISGGTGIAGGQQTFDLSTVFAGSGLVYRATCSDPWLAQAGVTGSDLTLQYGPQLGIVTITVYAAHAASGYEVSTMFTVDVVSFPLAIRINCGGKASGLWEADRSFSAGVPYRTQAPIADTTNFPSKIYQSCRVGQDFTYSFPEVGNGTYHVRLGFAELIQNTAGACVFNVKIEGVTVLSRLDVFTMAGGKNIGYPTQFKVVVSDGNGLQIRFRGVSGDAFVNGIMISAAAPRGMTSLPVGLNAGTDPDTGAYELANAVDFYMDRTEVTKAKWDAVRNWGLTNGFTDLPAGGGKSTNHPVQMVNWFDCVKWCNARSLMEGLTPVYYTSNDQSAVYMTGEQVPDEEALNWNGGYRLPTETEWEYAARGRLAGKRFPWGDTISQRRANYNSQNRPAYDRSSTPGLHPGFSDGIAPYTSPVATFVAYGFGAGLFDMSGNVAEWCWTEDPLSAPFQATRGGSWSVNADRCRVTDRALTNPAFRNNDTGFRAVMSKP